MRQRSKLHLSKVVCRPWAIVVYNVEPTLDQCRNAIWAIATHPKVLGLTLDPKLTYNTHIHNISVHAHKPLQIMNALNATGWGKQKETLKAAYKAVMRPALEYAFSVWSHIASSTSINKSRSCRSSIENCHRMHTRHKHTSA